MTEEEEIEGVTRMIQYYCKKKHHTDGKTMCPECQELVAYMAERRHKCPWGDAKPFCANCPIHCYKPEMREKIRAVMRYAAPRVTLVHPIMAFKHAHETLKCNRKHKKEAKERAKAGIVDPHPERAEIAALKEKAAALKLKQKEEAEKENAKRMKKVSKSAPVSEKLNSQTENIKQTEVKVEATSVVTKEGDKD